MMENNSDPRVELDHLINRGQSNFENVKRPLPPGAKGFMWLVMVAATILIAVIAWTAWGPKDDTLAEEAIPLRSGINNPLTLPTVKSPATPKVEETNVVDPEPVIPIIVGGNTGVMPLQNDTVARRLRSPLRADTGASQQTAQTDSHNTISGDAGPLADKLRPLELSPSIAGQLGDRNFLITQGTMIDCVMQTKLITGQPGLLTCISTQNVMSANGKVILIDAGTKFVGYQTGGIEQGQPRAFVAWHRLETPNGVILNLDSPGTGPLGEAGVDGAIDHHFWERFGNAILLSLVGDFGNWLSNKGSRGDNNIRFDNTADGGQEIVAKILEHSLDIPPTLYKNQGERVGIMVARDLDFSKVYDLQPTL